MPIPEYVTTDFYLAAFLVHKGATILGLQRLGAKKVNFRFATGEELHGLLRLYWSGDLTPVVPWELAMCHRRLKCLSIDRYDPPAPPPSPPDIPPEAASPSPHADQ